MTLMSQQRPTDTIASISPAELHLRQIRDKLLTHKMSQTACLTPMKNTTPPSLDNENGVSLSASLPNIIHLQQRTSRPTPTFFTTRSIFMTKLEKERHLSGESGGLTLNGTRRRTSTDSSNAVTTSMLSSSPSPSSFSSPASQPPSSSMPKEFRITPDVTYSAPPGGGTRRMPRTPRVHPHHQHSLAITQQSHHCNINNKNVCCCNGVLGGDTTRSRAEAISFKESEEAILSPIYDEGQTSEYFDQCFDILGELGYGSFGVVYKVRSQDDGKCYAVKKCDASVPGQGRNKFDEVYKHQTLPKHENCVEFISAWQEKGFLYIQTELCETSLSKLTEARHDFPERLVWKYFIDLLLAVRHLHDHDLIHMDIKPDNIFISREGICKLGDFGLMLDLCNDELDDAIEGDSRYCAAEVIQHGQYRKSADIFSLGLTILELATDLSLPNSGEAWHQLRSGKIPDMVKQRMSNRLCEIIEDMIRWEWWRRPDVNQILDRPYVRSWYRWRQVEMCGKRTVQTLYTSFLSLVSLFYVFINLCLLTPITSVLPSNWFSLLVSPFTSSTSSSLSSSPQSSSMMNMMNRSKVWRYGHHLTASRVSGPAVCPVNASFSDDEDVDLFPTPSVSKDPLELSNGSDVKKRVENEYDVRAQHQTQSPTSCKIAPTTLFNLSKCIEDDETPTKISWSHCTSNNSSCVAATANGNHDSSEAQKSPIMNLMKTFDALGDEDYDDER